MRFLVIIFSWIATSAWAQTTTSQTTVQQVSSPLAVQIVGEQYIGAKTDSPTTTDLYIDAFYTLAEGHRLRLVQGATKLYEIAAVGENEVQLSDTLLFHYWTLNPDFYGFDLKLRSGLTAPLSEASQRSGVLTKPNVRLQITRKFLDEKLTVSYRPAVRYYLNQYTSTVDGIPLPRWALSHSALVDYKFTPKFSVTALAVGGFTFYEQVAAGSNEAGGSYEFDVSLSYIWNDTFTTRVGMNQADKFFKEGRFEANLYDPESTRFYLGVDVSL